MTPQDFDRFLQLQQHIIESLSRIAIALEHMIPPKPAPNYQLELENFATFDWSSIGAVVVSSDQGGATAVRWSNFTYLRRSPSNKFGTAIWFSRCTGKDERGENEYERLVTFKSISVPEPLPPRVTSSMNSRQKDALRH